MSNHAQVEQPMKNLQQVDQILAVSSAKGGVGKSTTSVNLAAALKYRGAKVGLMDCDIYGPSLPQMLNLRQQPELTEDEELIPPRAFGMPVISMGLLLNQPDVPVVWRGPMLHKMIQQFLFGVQWNSLDYLILDLPPGTGDVQLTLTQTAPITGAIVVTTPQEVSLIDARKGIEMFTKCGIRLLGIVENMAYFVCPHCGEKDEIFKANGGQKLAEQTQTTLLASIPILPEIPQKADQGCPIVLEQPESPAGQAYLKLAQKIEEAFQ
ncbi:MAG: ATP-binding protein [Planctomycetota bacterium]|nr:MAG: ATP-binding protein [Planctomycetota bacterium]